MRGLPQLQGSPEFCHCFRVYSFLQKPNPIQPHTQPISAVERGARHTESISPGCPSQAPFQRAPRINPRLLCLSPWPASELEREEPQTESLLASVHFGLIPSPKPLEDNAKPVGFRCWKEEAYSLGPQACFGLPSHPQSGRSSRNKGGPCKKAQAFRRRPTAGKRGSIRQSTVNLGVGRTLQPRDRPNCWAPEGSRLWMTTRLLIFPALPPQLLSGPKEEAQGHGSRKNLGFPTCQGYPRCAASIGEAPLGLLALSVIYFRLAQPHNPQPSCGDI